MSNTKKRRNNSRSKTTKTSKRRKIRHGCDLIFFYNNLPHELWDNHVVPPISRDWLFVSQKYNQLATTCLLSDQRIVDRITYPISGPAYFGLAHKWKSETALRLVLKLPEYDPAEAGSNSLRYSVGNGTINLVKILLDDGKVDLNEAFPAAVFPRDNICMVKYLLQEPRIDPAANNNAAIRITAQGGNWDYAELLIDDPRVDPSIDDHHVLFEAVKYKWAAPFIEKLIRHPKIDPSIHNNKALQIAQRFVSESIVEILRKDPRVIARLNSY